MPSLKNKVADEDLRLSLTLRCVLVCDFTPQGFRAARPKISDQLTHFTSCFLRPLNVRPTMAQSSAESLPKRH